MKTLKHIELFEKWSSNFNRTLQGAYQTALDYKKHGDTNKKAEDILHYANRSISQKIFSVEFSSGTKLNFTHDPEFILKPIQNFFKENGDTSKLKKKGKELLKGQLNVDRSNFILIPITLKNKVNKENEEIPLKEEQRKGTLLFRDGKIYGYIRTRNTSYLPYPDAEIRFSNRKSIEDFFAMTIQAVLSSPEKSEIADGWGIGVDKNLPGDTQEKQIILGLIQKIILEKDMRQYTI
jgi:hypothetical protein